MNEVKENSKPLMVDEFMKIKIGEEDFCNSKVSDLGIDWAYDIQLLDFDSLTKRWLPESCIGLCQGQPVEETFSEMIQSGVWHLVQRDQDSFKDQLQLSAAIIERPNVFLDNPMAEIFRQPKGIFQEHRWTFRSSSEKGIVMKAIQTYLNTVSGTTGIGQFLGFVADELFTNALFDAPFVQDKYSIDRTSVIVLDPDVMAQMILAHDDERVFIGCQDLFGTLDCEGLLRQVDRCFKLGAADAMNMGTGGAGIGILRVISLSNDLYVIAEEEKRTLIGCTFLLGKSSKSTRLRHKNIHFTRFRDVDSGSAVLRLEKRGRRACLKISGELTGSSETVGLDLTGTDELSLDMKDLSSANEKGLEQLVSWASQYVDLKGISISNASLPIVQMVNKIKNENFIPKNNSMTIEFQSVYMPFECGNCKDMVKILFIQQEKSSQITTPASLSQKVPSCKICQDKLTLQLDWEKYLRS